MSRVRPGTCPYCAWALAEDRDVERVVGGAPAVLARLDPGVARRVEAGGAGAAFAPAAARTGGRLASLVARVARVGAGREDQVPAHRATEVQDVVTRRRMCREGDAPRLRRNAAVG